MGGQPDLAGSCSVGGRDARRVRRLRSPLAEGRRRPHAPLVPRAVDGVAVSPPLLAHGAQLFAAATPRRRRAARRLVAGAAGRVPPRFFSPTPRRRRRSPTRTICPLSPSASRLLLRSSFAPFASAIARRSSHSLASTAVVGVLYSPWLLRLREAVGLVAERAPQRLAGGALLDSAVALAYAFVSLSFGESLPCSRSSHCRRRRAGASVPAVARRKRAARRARDRRAVAGRFPSPERPVG